MLQLTVLGYILVPIFTSDRWCADTPHAAICITFAEHLATEACACMQSARAERWRLSLTAPCSRKRRVAVTCCRYVTIGYATLMALVGAWEASSRPSWTFRVCMHHDEQLCMRHDEILHMLTHRDSKALDSLMARAAHGTSMQ